MKSLLFTLVLASIVLLGCKSNRGLTVAHKSSGVAGAVVMKPGPGNAMADQRVGSKLH